METKDMDESSWSIYRCAPSATLSIGDQLTASGLTGVYVPEVTIRRRVPRTKQFEVKRISVLPSFLFLEGHIWKMPAKIARKVRPMVINGKFASATSWEIADMRGTLGVDQFMRNNPRKDPALSIQVGDHVFICSGPLKGVKGVVAIRYQNHCIIETGSFWGALKVYTFLLRKDAS